MAKAIVNARLGDEWEAHSAGTKPTGYVHPMALEVLREIRVEHEGISKQVDEFRDETFDLVVTVCDSAAEERPIGSGREEWSIKVFPIRRLPMISTTSARCGMT